MPKELDFSEMNMGEICALLDGCVHDVMGAAGGALAWLDVITLGHEPPTKEQIAELRAILSRSANTWGKAHLRRVAIANAQQRRAG